MRVNRTMVNRTFSQNRTCYLGFFEFLFEKKCAKNVRFLFHENVRFTHTPCIGNILRNFKFNIFFKRFDFFANYENSANSDFFQLDPTRNELITSFLKKKTNSAKILIFEV